MFKKIFWDLESLFSNRGILGIFYPINPKWKISGLLLTISCSRLERDQSFCYFLPGFLKNLIDFLSYRTGNPSPEWFSWDFPQESSCLRIFKKNFGIKIVDKSAEFFVSFFVTFELFFNLRGSFREFFPKFLKKFPWILFCWMGNTTRKPPLKFIYYINPNLLSSSTQSL